MSSSAWPLWPQDSFGVIWIGHPTMFRAFFYAGLASVFFYLLFRSALPKPIPGIPYNEMALRSPLGDLPSLHKFLKGKDTNSQKYGEDIAQNRNMIEWFSRQLHNNQSPLMQIFLSPSLGSNKPWILLGDGREATDLMARRTHEFDRSPLVRDFIGGALPSHHIVKPTNDEYRANRRLLQDLMVPTFLNNIAGPALHSRTLNLIRMWESKATLAAGRPFDISGDVYEALFDTVAGFIFGDDFPTAIQPNLATYSKMVESNRDSRDTASQTPDDDLDVPATFPKAPIHEDIQAILDMYKWATRARGVSPRLNWWIVKRCPFYRRSHRIREAFLRRELLTAARKMEKFKPNSHSNEVADTAAIDLIVQRERELAEKEGREPCYDSRTMKDETLGLVFAGHDSASATTCWGIKLLTDNPGVQTQFRQAMRTAFPSAWRERRSPSMKEITTVKAPYIDAVVEEIFRRGGTAPLVERIATQDTQLLGHNIPKGSIIIMPVGGPSLISPGFESSIAEHCRSPTSIAAAKNGRGRYWDPRNVDAFLPDRWLVNKGEKDDEKTGEKLEFDPLAGPQLAFGHGPRGCFGKRLARLALRMELILIVWNFELLPCPKQLSGYTSTVGFANAPDQAYARLQKVEIGGAE